MKQLGFTCKLAPTGSEGFTKIDDEGNKIVLPAISDDAARAWHLHYVLADSPEACRSQAARHRAMVAHADRFHRLCTGGVTMRRNDLPFLLHAFALAGDGVRLAIGLIPPQESSRG